MSANGDILRYLQGHDAVIEWVFDKVTLFGTVAPVSLITKYNELGHLPAFTHAVPGAIWSFPRLCMLK